MNPRTRKKIYEPFFSTKGAQGSGLGLWLVSNIVDKHRGSIHVRSKSDSDATGTVFTLIFPGSGAEGKTAGFSEATA
jgi:signal transduction histidine kinase